MSANKSNKIIFCIIESPFAPFTKDDAEKAAIESRRNEQYVNACMADAFARGEIPFASHALYTRCIDGVKVLDDTIPEERTKGMRAGFDMANALNFLAEHFRELSEHATWDDISVVRAFYVDRGWSRGMRDGLCDAQLNNFSTDIRTLNGYWGRENDVRQQIQFCDKIK